jgi:hypothetical protein
VGDQAGQDVRSRWSFDGYIDRLENVYTRIVQGHRRGKPMDLRSG